MSEIQKYHLGWDYEEADMYPSENGDYVLYTDHLAVVAEKEADWQLKYDILGQDYEQKWGLSMRQAEQIAALQARIKELESLERLYKESLEKYQLWKFDDEARIKELTEALDSIRATARAVMEAKDHELNIDPEWVIAKTQAALGGNE
jgi:hypothetical protein